MKRTILASLIFLIPLFIYSCSSNPAYPPINTIYNEDQPTPNPVVTDQEIVESSNAFGLKLFNKINEFETDKNIFISPLSISMALGMAYNGAEGTTKTEMHTVLEFGNFGLEGINRANKNIIDLINTLDPNVKVQIANSMWVDPGMSLTPDFVRTNQEYYYAKIENVDFSDPSTVNVINAWVNEATNGTIEKLVDRLSPQTIMMIINALYFKGPWATPFDKGLTDKTPFYKEDGEIFECDMMQTHGTFGYYENSYFEAVDLPYGNGNFSMTIFLPKEDYNIDAVVSMMDAEYYNLYLSHFSDLEFSRFMMPKFKYEYKLTLNDVLIQLGMDTAFTRNADFTNMCAPGGIFISEVKHKTFVAVDEEGTEAAAVTSIEYARGGYPGGSFIIDHPFFFVIREKETDTILFMGKILEPDWAN